MPTKNLGVTRVQFIERLVGRGLGYPEACTAYDALISVFEDAIIQGNKINVGKVGSIVPVRLDPKVVHMGFKNEGGTIKRVKREYILGHRIRFKFNLHRAFVKKHALNWF